MLVDSSDEFWTLYKCKSIFITCSARLWDGGVVAIDVDVVLLYYLHQHDAAL